MIKIFATDKVKEIDRYTIEHEPVRSIDLVERAARAFVREFALRFGKQQRVIVFAGQGNNGADALAVARLLIEDSFGRVETYLFNPKGQLSEECSQCAFLLRNMGKAAHFTEVRGTFSPPALGKQDTVIDGLFGSGLNRPLEKGFANLVAYINRSEATVVSIDIPSGLFGEDNRANNPDVIVKADAVFTFGFPKLAFLLPDNEPYVETWKILDIGLHPGAIEATPASCYLMTEGDIDSVLRPRSKFAHKGMFGHALLIAGSRGKMGAAVLAAKACLRSGAGLITAHVPTCGETVMQTAFPEAMLSLDNNADFLTSLPNLSGYSAVGIGPGLGQRPESAAALKALLETADKPLVMDADALNMLSADPGMLEQIPPRSILTPHPKEFDRLAGASPNAYERLMKAQAFAVSHKLYIVLKGAYTAGCTPEGTVYFNNTGNPGMATAGSGDVLTGVILGLLAAGYAPETAATVGVLIHGAAGDMAACYRSQESLIAGDIVDMLGKVFLNRNN
jgi:NAD(P)H-hydrate epimerase